MGAESSKGGRAAEIPYQTGMGQFPDVYRLLLTEEGDATLWEARPPPPFLDLLLASTLKCPYFFFS